MAKRVSAGLTAAEGRRFGLTVGIAFLVFAGIGWWRGHAIVWSVLATVGGLLALAGLIVPTQLGPVERAWMGLAHAISRVTTPVFMSIVYLGVVAPTGVLRRHLGHNPLVHQGPDSYWKDRSAGGGAASDLRRQF